MNFSIGPALWFVSVIMTLAVPWRGSAGNASDDLTLSAPPDATLPSASSTDPSITGWGGAASGCSPLLLEELRSVWINEVHYDNVGRDESEFIEVAGPAGSELSPWRLVLYNGETGAPYDTIHLTGTIPDEGCGYGAVAFDAPGLQNGVLSGYVRGDGIALVLDPWDQVAQFVSYEESFLAAEGPAAGMQAIDLGVAESDVCPAGQSLQRSGNFDSPTWVGPIASSPGRLNLGESFSPCAGPVVLFYRDSLQSSGAAAPVIARKWQARDGCGHWAEATQRIVVGAGAKPEFGWVPPDDEVECGDPVDPAHTGGEATAHRLSAQVDSLGRIWINEIRYDGVPSAGSEFVEIAGPAGFDLAGYALVFYESSGSTYGGVLHLQGTLGNENGSGFGALAFSPREVTGTGLQNGPGDGVALVHFPSRQVVQFLSYEGTLAARSGPAAHSLAREIGAAQSETSTGSIQLIGRGCSFEDLEWRGFNESSPGTLNALQGLTPNSGATVTHDDVEELVGLGDLVRVIHRVWKAAAGGAVIETEQRITVRDRTAPRIVEGPRESVAEVAPGCVSVIPDLRGGTVAMDNCTAADGLVLKQDPLPGTPLTSGQDSAVVITAADPCGNVSAPISIVVHPAPEIHVRIQAGPVSCSRSEDGFIWLESSGGRPPYQVTLDDGLAFSTESVHLFENLGWGPHSLRIEDAAGCHIELTPFVDGPPPLVVTPTVTPMLCFGETARLWVDASGGTPPYEFALSPGDHEPGPLFRNLAAGEYTVSVRDKQNCAASLVISIPAAAPLSVTVVATDCMCAGQADGTMALEIEGGNPPYQFSVDGNPPRRWELATVLHGCAAGVHEIEATDSNGCSFTAQAVVGQGRELIGLRAVPDQEVRAGGTVWVAVLATGSGPCSFQWYHGDAVLEPFNRCQVDSSELSSVLRIDTAHASDAGSYRVIAVGPCNSAELSFKLAVNAVWPELTLENLAIAEGDSGRREAVFRVQLSALGDSSVQVGYFTAPGTALPGEDYCPVAGTLQFGAGSGLPSERQPLRLSARRALGGMVVTWPNNAGECYVESCVDLSGRDWSPVCLPLDSLGDSFRAWVPLGPGQEFFRVRNRPRNEGTNGLVSEIRVAILGDSVAEADEQFHLVLTNAVGASIAGNGRATATILNDDLEEVEGEVAVVGITSGYEALALREQFARLGFASIFLPPGEARNVTLDNCALVIWNGSPDAEGDRRESDLKAVIAASQEGRPVYLMGEHLASDPPVSEGPLFDQWSEFSGLSPTQTCLRGGVIRPDLSLLHPVLSGPHGEVGEFFYEGDLDETAGAIPGVTVLARSGSADVLLALEVTGPHQSRRVAQNFLLSSGSSPASAEERGRLFRNAMEWLLGK